MTDDVTREMYDEATARKAVVAAAEAWACGSAGGLQHSKALEAYGALREQRGRKRERAQSLDDIELSLRSRDDALARAEQAEAQRDTLRAAGQALLDDLAQQALEEDSHPNRYRLPKALVVALQAALDATEAQAGGVTK